MADAVPHKPPMGGPTPVESGTPPAAATPPASSIPVSARPFPPTPVPAAAISPGPASPVPPPPQLVPANDAAKTAASPVPGPSKPGAPEPAKNVFQKIKAATVKAVGTAKQAIAQRIEEERKITNSKKKLFERGVTMAGFGGVLEAAKTPKNKARAILTAIGHKIADMVAGSLVSNSFRLIAITLVAGMIGGVSSWGAIGLLALATGVSSAVYTYGKGYLGDRFTGPKDKRAATKFFDRPRAINAGRAFLSGAANGAFGAWLAKLPLFQHVMHFIRDRVHAGVKSVTPDFNSAAASAAPVAPAAPASSVPSKLEAFGRRIGNSFRSAAGMQPAPPPVPPAAPPANAPLPAFPPP